MLVVYDFEGGSAAPVIKLARWYQSANDSVNGVAFPGCDVASHAPPCWGVADALGAGEAEARVNVGQTVHDTIAPPGGANVDETLNDSEFGEAGIDLTDAGVFTAGTCESFGKAFGVSRSSGNSGTAQMKDLVGPADFTLANCGTVITRKVTDPSPDPNDHSFPFSTNVTTTPSTTTSPFSLKNGGSNTITNVNPASGRNVTENDPAPGYALTSIDCSASTVPAANYSTDTTTRAVTFSIAAGETLDCTFTNTLQQGAIKITKTSSKAAATPLSGAHFRVCTNDGPYTAQNPCTPAKTGSDDLGPTPNTGSVCIDNLAFGDYYVSEKSAPSGYAIDDDAAHKVTVDNNAKCSDTTYVGESRTFTDTPLTDILAKAKSQATGGTQSSVKCTDSNGNDIGDSPDPDTGFADPAQVTANGLKPGTYTCTVVIDP